ncbi:MAG: DUF4065 domain-containing protein [Candidatus Saccharibacteria bacterium]|nr:DUF4065 domain-containing protein [Candidatus Saccharibacteria bacterium]
MQKELKSPYQAMDIADWFIDRANKDLTNNNPKSTEKEYAEYISHLKLQKLLYFTQAAHLALYERALFKDKIEAWDYGPVIPSVYQHFKSQRSRFIRNPKSLQYKKIDKDAQEFLEQIWQIFGKFSASKLVNLTHSHEPWKSACKKTNRIITQDALKAYYKNIFSFKD